MKLRSYYGTRWKRYRVYIICNCNPKLIAKLLLPTLPIAIDYALSMYPQLKNSQWGVIEEPSPPSLEVRKQRGRAVAQLVRKLDDHGKQSKFCHILIKDKEY